MATHHLWTLAVIGIGWGALFYVGGRRAVRSVIDVPDLIAQVPFLTGTIQVVAFVAVAVVALGFFIALGRFFDVHKM